MSDDVNLIVESGPDKGLEIRVPPSGARLGRASGNDIVLTDPALSRFHCRFYYKNGRELHVSDLASTNETLINGQPSVDGRLRVGDRVTIGQTVLKVLRDTPPGVEPEPERAASAQPPSAAPGPVAAPSSETLEPLKEPDVVDLGLTRAEEFELAPSKPSEPWSWKRAALVGTVALLAVVVGYVSWILWRSPARPSRAPAAEGQRLEIYYEKIEASPKNIFRYAVTLQGGVLSVRIDNLETGQHISREKNTDPKVTDLLAQSLEQSGFFQLMNEYTGVTPNVWDLTDLTLVIDRRCHRVKVLNRIEPEPFKKAREEIEEFVRNEMGLHALALPPEKLLELGRNAWLTGKKLFEEREVRYDNLARAIRALTEAETLVESLEPKPPFYEEAIALREEARRQLQAKYEDYMFRADRAIKLNDWKEANTHLQTLLEILSDRSDERYQKVYKKLVDVQRRLTRK